MTPTTPPEAPIKNDTLKQATPESQPETASLQAQPEPTHSEPEADKIPSESPIATPETRPVPPPTLPGRGGQEHKYLQNLITRWAHGMGWKADIEAPAGDGKIDVLLSQGKTSVACEIAITTTIDHEINNLRKCLESGATWVVSVSNESRKLQQIRKAALAKLPKSSHERIRFFDPEELFAFVEKITAKQSSREATIRGYKVNLAYQTLNPENKSARKQAIGTIISNAMRREK